MSLRLPPALPLRSTTLDLAARTHVMGVLNVTPDSFSDGGKYRGVDAAVAAAEQMVSDGADVIDIGGESTRPGAQPVSPEEEIGRVVPVIERLAGCGAPISVDTTKAEVAAAAVEAGAEIVNDISAATIEPQILNVAAAKEAAIILSHLRGTPRNMQDDPTYDDVVRDVRDELLASAARAEDAGILSARTLLDPGIGFGKTLAHNLELLARLEELADTGYAVLVGTSRKSFIGKVLGGAPPGERVHGTAATVALAIARGAAMVRVHDVAAMVDVARMADAVTRARAA